MEKFKKVDNTKGVYTFWCPGCKTHHSVWTEHEGYDHPIWEYNGNVNSPTVHPSILVTHPVGGVNDICHSFIRDGRIEYLTDCTHELAGKTIILEDM
jgi:hypothetical protein